MVLTTGKVAALLRVTARTAGKLCDSGRLVSHKIPGAGHRRVLLSDLLQFMRSNAFPEPWIVEAETLGKQSGPPGSGGCVPQDPTP